MEDTPAGAPGHPERYAGVNKTIRYSEGIFVGYRHYDQAGIAPLFPFGYGLSYTRFAYSGLKISKVADGLDVAFTVRNTGSVAGSDAPQVYLGPDVTAGVPMAPKALAGFTRVSLEPGEARAVRIHVPARQLAYWSEAKHGWAPTKGPRAVYVGASSRDIRLTGKSGGGAS
jgi:beta-glucosidase